MTVSTTTAANSYLGNGAVATYAFSFLIHADSDLRVTKEDDGGNISTLTLTTDYTVSGAGNAAGGTITLTAGSLPNGYTLVIARSVDFLQQTSLPEGSRFHGSTIERVFDRLCMMCQQLLGLSNRSIKLPASETTATDLPAASTRAGLALVFDANGNPGVGGIPSVSSSTPGAWDSTPVKATGATQYRTLADHFATLPDSLITPTGGATPRSLADHTEITEGVRLSDDIQISGGKANLFVPDRSARSAIRYGSATTVKIYGNGSCMNGFLWFGNRTKRGQFIDYPSFENTVSTVTSLGAESAVATENWYAVFACSNDGDSSCVMKIMPILRVGSITGNVITLNKAGEGIHSVIAKSYSWNSINNLSGVDCLVLREAGIFGGRVTTISANDATSVTVSSAGSLAAHDIICPAPPGYSRYSYLGSFYFDTAEVRNIADCANAVYAKMVQVTDPSLSGSGSVPSPTQVNFDGYISPFAKGVTISITASLSTASAGSFAEYIDHDSSGHTVATIYRDKSSTTTETIVNTVTAGFSVSQRLYYSNAGSLAANRTGGKIEVVGWIE